MLYRARYWLIGVTGLCLLVCVICFVFLMRCAGHKKGVEGIVPGVLTRLPFDLLTLIFGGGAVVCCCYIVTHISYIDSSISFLPLLTAGGTLTAVLLTVYFMDFAVRVKLGGVLRRTLVFALLRGIKRGAVWLADAMPAAARTVFIFLAVCILEIVVRQGEERGGILFLTYA